MNKEELRRYLMDGMVILFTTVIVVLYMIDNSDKKKVPIQYRASVHLLNK